MSRKSDKREDTKINPRCQEQKGENSSCETEIRYRCDA